MSVRPLSSVLKTFAVLDVVAAAPEPVRLADVARAVEEARAATHQRLQTLVEAGWVEQTEDGRYRLALRIVAHAAMAMEQANLGARLADILHDMVAESGETASMAVLDGHEAVIMRRVEAKGILRADLRVGTRLDLARTALGRVLSAFARPEALVRLAEAGVVLPEAELVERIRADGYAVSGITGPRTVSAVAAPVVDSHGDCIAALSLSGPTAGFNTQTCASVVVAAAARVNARLRGARE